MKFKIRTHMIRRSQCVEVYDDDNRLVAVIYPHQVGLHVVSKYLLDAVVDQETPPGVMIKLGKATWS